jgi:hypothetical protein
MGPAHWRLRPLRPDKRLLELLHPTAPRWPASSRPRMSSCGWSRKTRPGAFIPIRSASNIWYGTGSGVDQALPDQPFGEPLSAAASSALTASSDSTAALDTNAARAAADPTRLSAQAACARTTGSGSDNARASTRTASGDPQLPAATSASLQLPSPTQTLRAKPARPARRMADPLENASQAASSSATSSSSISDGASVPGREAAADELCPARPLEVEVEVEVEVDPLLAR